MADLSKDTLLFAEEKRRMCMSYQLCEGCPLDGTRCEFSTSSSLLDPENDKRILEVVQNWHDNNPLRTYKEDFFEKFPNAKKYDDGTPMACRNDIYGNVKDCSGRCCDVCWNEPMEDKT